MAWSTILQQHVQVLRDNLLAHEDDWPAITAEARVGAQTVGRFARRHINYQNPRLTTLIHIADALERITHATAS